MDDILNQIDSHCRAEFSKFFRQKYWRLLKAAFNKDEKRPDYTDPNVIANIVAPYLTMAASDAPLAIDTTPKHIWMLWQQGWDTAPPLVKACAESWRSQNPDWELHLVDEKTISKFAPTYEQVRLPKAARTAQSNIARLCLLAEHGGVWADSTLFCQQPLDNWLPKVMAAEFFMFSEPRPYRYSDIWFLASGANSQLISAWLALVRNYWQHFNRPHHYYWMEYLFEYLVAQDTQVADCWRNVPKLTALGPLVVGGRAFDLNVPPPTLAMIEQKTVPAHKLSHKWRFKGQLAGTPVGLLTGLDRL